MRAVDRLPPKTYQSGPQKWIEEARVMRQNPGQWFLVFEFARITQAQNWACRARSGNTLAFTPADEFEFVTRGAEVYGRYK